MVKTTPLADDTHKNLKMVQSILKEEYNIDMTLTDVIAYIIPDAKRSVEIILDEIIKKREMSNNETKHDKCEADATIIDS